MDCWLNLLHQSVTEESGKERRQCLLFVESADKLTDVQQSAVQCQLLFVPLRDKSGLSTYP